jgi:hypothetical protein
MNNQDDTIAGLIMEQKATIEAQTKEIKRLKEGAMQLSTMVLGHFVNETDFSDDLSMQSFAIHVKEDLCK